MDKITRVNVLFCPCVVRKYSAHVGTKVLNMRHQAQKGFSGIFFGIQLYQRGYLLYVPSTRKIISLYDVIFDERFSIVLAYTSQNYSEAMVMRPDMTLTHCATSSRGRNGDIITIT